MKRIVGFSFLFIFMAFAAFVFFVSGVSIIENSVDFEQAQGIKLVGQSLLVLSGLIVILGAFAAWEFLQIKA